MERAIPTTLLFGILSWIPFLLIVILGIIPFTLLWCYRILVTVILRILLRKDLSAPMLLPEIGFATDGIWTQPRTAVAFIHYLDGPLDLEAFKQRILGIIHGEITRHGESVPNYDRLISSYPTTWLGYLFWTKLTTPFDISNHLKIHCRQEIDEGILNIDDIVQKWFGSPFPKDRPLWDVILIQDFQDESGMRRSLFGFRIHHIIGDGYSMLDFLERVFDQNPTRPAAQVLPKRKPMTIRETLNMWFYLPLTQGINLAGLFFHSDHFSSLKSDCANSYSNTSTDLSELLLIRKKMSAAIGVPVPFVTMILFIFGTALKKTLLFNNSNVRESTESSHLCSSLRDLKIGIAMPRSAPHPTGTFCNHWSYGALEVPLAEENPVKRLERMVSNISGMNGCHAFEMNAISTSHLFSQLPQFAVDAMLNNASGITIGITNLPGPCSPAHIFGRQILEKYLIVGPQAKHASFVVGCFSYNNQLTISIIGNAQVFNKQMGEDVLKNFKDEVKYLLANGITID